jgi:hypothetical protein
MRLQVLSPAEIKKMIEGMEQECSSIKKNALSLAWYTRGSCTYEDVLNMSAEERKAITELINSNLETTKKTNLPFF